MPDALEWLLLMPSLPTEPSRHRVAVWRELRRIGAAPIGSGTWVIPDVQPFAAGVDRVRELAVREGGQVVILDARPRDEAAEALLRDAFERVRRDEWTEFMSECGKFLQQIDAELAKRRFTLGELDEEEQSMDRLRRWHGNLLDRDVLDLPESGSATQALGVCDARLGDFAERVLSERTESGSLDPAG